jgi:hypothetical protein
MKTTLKNSEALNKIVTIDPISKLEELKWWAPSNKLVYELIRKAIESKNCVVTEESIMADSKGEYMVLIASFATMNPSDAFPETGYYQPTVIVSNKNCKRSKFEAILALRNPLNNTLIFPRTLSTTNFFSSLYAVTKPEKFAEHIAGLNAHVEFEKIYAFANKLNDETLKATKQDAYAIFNEYFFEKSKITSVQATYLSKEYATLFKNPEQITIGKLYAIYNKMYMEYVHPRYFFETFLRTLRPTFVNLLDGKISDAAKPKFSTAEEPSLTAETPETHIKVEGLPF